MDRPRMRWVLAAVILLALWPTAAMADDDDDDDEEQAIEARADSVSVFDGAVVIPRPTGWNVGRPGAGAVAVFHSATDDRAQIEVRVSADVEERRWERFWRAFDNDLRKVGFETYRPRSTRRFGGRPGLLYEYEFQREGREDYRLVVWHTHESDRAWVFTIFFVETRRDAYLPTFEEMLEAVEWNY